MRKAKAPKPITIPVTITPEMAVHIRAHGQANYRSDRQTIAWALDKVFGSKSTKEKGGKKPIAQENVGFYIGMENDYFQEE